MVQGSCEGCETKCGMVFRPVCSSDQMTVYPNKCQAQCADVNDTVECKVGLNYKYLCIINNFIN